MKKFVTKTLIILSCCVLFSEEKKIGLVLSGGGIKGFGHLGTLQMIDSLNIPIDFVVGSSIGAISAALYATGHSPPEIDIIGSQTNWKEIFGQSRSRDELLYFRKKDHSKFNLTFFLRGFRPTTPISLSNGQYSYEHLLDLFSEYTHISNFDNLLIPFRCNATDIISGEEYIFNKGSLAKSLRVSTSIPTIFSPIEYEDRLLVDGGLINNIPTNLAESLGANYIISSDVTSDDKSKDEIIDIFNIVYKIMDLYGSKNKKINSRKSDILVKPKINDLNVVSYNVDDINKMKLEGKKAAYENLNYFLKLQKKENLLINISAIPQNKFKLDSLILSNDLKDDSIIHNLFNLKSEIYKSKITDNILKIRSLKRYHNVYSKYKKNNFNNTYDMYLFGEKNQPIILNEINVIGNNKISNNKILSMFSLKKNEELDIIKLNEEIKTAYETELFEYINYDLFNEGTYTLNINVKEAEDKKLKLGVLWDNYYKLIGKIKIDIFNKPLKNLRFQNELLFSGLKRNQLSIYYLINNNSKSNLIPFIEFTNQIKNIGLYNFFNENTIQNIEHNYKSFSYGVIYPIYKYGSFEISSTKFNSKYKFEINRNDNNFKNNNISLYKFEFDLDQIDDLLHPKNGYRLNLNFKKSYDNFFTSNESLMPVSNGFQIFNLNFENYKSINFNHTFRIFNIVRKSSQLIPTYLTTFYGGTDWALGYKEFNLTANDLNLFGMEYQYHFKSSVTYRFVINKLVKINNHNNGPLNYGISIKIRSFLGPINFTYAKGHKIPYNKNSREIRLFYFNFGMTL